MPLCLFALAGRSSRLKRRQRLAFGLITVVGPAILWNPLYCCVNQSPKQLGGAKSCFGAAEQVPLRAGQLELARDQEANEAKETEEDDDDDDQPGQSEASRKSNSPVSRCESRALAGSHSGHLKPAVTGGHRLHQQAGRVVLPAGRLAICYWRWRFYRRKSMAARAFSFDDDTAAKVGLSFWCEKSHYQADKICCPTAPRCHRRETGPPRASRDEQLLLSATS